MNSQVSLQIIFTVLEFVKRILKLFQHVILSCPAAQLDCYFFDCFNSGWWSICMKFHFRSVSTTLYDQYNNVLPIRGPFRLENTYCLEPSQKFPSQRVEQILRELLEEYLKDEEYRPELCRQMTPSLSEVILVEQPTTELFSYFCWRSECQGGSSSSGKSPLFTQYWMGSCALEGLEGKGNIVEIWSAFPPSPPSPV